MRTPFAVTFPTFETVSVQVTTCPGAAVAGHRLVRLMRVKAGGFGGVTPPPEMPPPVSGGGGGAGGVGGTGGSGGGSGGTGGIGGMGGIGGTVSWLFLNVQATAPAGGSGIVTVAPLTVTVTPLHAIPPSVHPAGTVSVTMKDPGARPVNVRWLAPAVTPSSTSENGPREPVKAKACVLSGTASLTMRIVPRRWLVIVHTTWSPWPTGTPSGPASEPEATTAPAPFWSRQEIVVA